MGMVSSYKSRLSYENPAVNSLNALKRRSILNDDNLFGPSALNRWASSLRSSFLWHLLSILPFWTCSWTVLWCRLFKDGHLILSFVAFARGFWSFYHEKMSHLDHPPRRITTLTPRTDRQTNRQRSPFLAHRSSDLRPWDYADCDFSCFLVKYLLRARRCSP